MFASLFVVATAGSVTLAGCGDDEESSSAGSAPAVVASTTQVADLARNVAGERAEVTGILAANSDPHDYEPSPSDVAAVAEADLIVSSGGDLDLWLDEVVESSGSGAPLLTLIDSVETIADNDAHSDDEHAEEEDEEHDEEGVDPHWWQSPVNAISAVGAIRDELVAVDTGGANEYMRNASDYISELEQLDAEIAGCMTAVPAEQRKLVTSHDALGYFAHRYEIEVVGSTIPALTTQAQPSAGETAELVGLIRSEGVQAVFPEVGAGAQLEEAIAGETDAEVGAELYADTLGPDGSDGATYLQATAANAAAITSGLSSANASCEISMP